jgi:hypothetical protein
VTKDPIGFAGGINFYAYVGNDPVKWIDSLGLAGALPAPMPFPPLLPPVFIPGTPENKAWTDSVINLINKIKEAIDNLIIGPWPGSGEQNKPEEWPKPDDWRGQCIRLYAICINEQWGGNCSNCLNKCTAQHEWPFQDCSPDKKCKR